MGEHCRGYRSSGGGEKNVMTGDRIVFTVIGGFLGAGKTSFVNRILTHDTATRFAVMVNDFGALNIDAALINDSDTSSGSRKVMQLANGCICCSLAGGLVDGLLELMRYRDQIDHILIEASGVSNPSRIMDFARLDGDLRPGLTLVLVDVVQLGEQLADARLAQTLSDQLDSADLFLLTKTDLAAAEDISEVKRILTHRQPRVPSAVLAKDDLDLARFLVSGAADDAIPTAHTNDGVDGHGFNSVGMVATRPIERIDFSRLCKLYSNIILRGKGMICFSDGGAIWQQTGRLIDLMPADAQAKSLDGGQDSRLVVISPDDLDDVTAAFSKIGFSISAPP
jgi:G3E family GTPase